MNHPLVTVLVAIYNTENYLEQCLDSLCRQTLPQLQIVCVDDASTDGSLAVARRYAARDERIEVIALPENRGQAYARNQALARARGEYVAFLDSDDWMSADCLEQAVRTFTEHRQTDCVLLHTLYHYSSTREEEYPMPHFEAMTGYEAFVRSLTWQIHGVYVVRAALHHRYPYDDSARAFSDDNTTRLHYLHAREVRLCDGTYYYRQRATSVSHAFSMRRFDYLIANESMKRTLVSEGVEDRLLNLYERHRWLNLIDAYMLYYRHRDTLAPAERAEALSLMRRIWAEVEVARLPLALRLKPGYAPIHGSWLCFRMQEEAYFGLRRLMGR